MGSCVPYLIWLYSSLGGCQYNLTPQNFLERSVNTGGSLRTWEESEYLSQTKIFWHLPVSELWVQLVRLSVFPLASKTFPVSVVSWQLSAGCELEVPQCPWKDITDIVPFIFHSLWLPRCFKKYTRRAFFGQGQHYISLLHCQVFQRCIHVWDSLGHITHITASDKCTPAVSFFLHL